MFAPPEWEFAGNGRFDDPGKGVDDAAEGGFRLIYCASGREAAFGETIARFRRSLAPVLVALGTEDLDFSDLIGRDRRLTQQAAEYIYNAAVVRGESAFCGIKYASRLNRDWEPWAVFADRMLHAPENLYQTITREDPDLLRAAKVLDIEVR